jgi:transcriptional regulator with XRE-family HTH domain
MNTTGYRIRRAREHFNETQEVFASRLSIKQTFLSEVENDKRAPTRSMLSKLYVNYGINENWVMTGEDDMITNDPELVVVVPLKRDLFEKVFVGVDDYLHKTNTPLDSRIKAKVIYSYMQFFTINKGYNEKAMSDHIENTISMVITVIKGDING